MDEATNASALQTSVHHVSNSAVSLVFRAVGMLFLLETVYVTLIIAALNPTFSAYQDWALRFLWLALTIKFVVEAVWIGLVVAAWGGTNYYLDDGHLIRYAGIRRRDENVYDLSILKTVELHQGWWGRLFNYGDIRLVFSSSGYSETISLNAIYNPKKYEHVLKARLNLEPASKINEPWAGVRPG